MSKLLSRTPTPRLSEPETAPVSNLFNRMEQLEKESEIGSQNGQTRWMIPYADLLTLLLGFFVVLFAVSHVKDEPKTAPKKPEAHAAQQQTEKPDQDQALLKRLQQQLGSDLRSRDIDIRQQERGLVISLKDDILFAPGSAELSPEARRTLDVLVSRLSGALGQQDARPIRVEGHTDNTPIATARYPSNWELSTARATNIVRYLVDSRRLPPGRLSAAGYGEYKPVENNSSIEGKQKNRRVDIVVLNAYTAQQEPPPLDSKSVEEEGIREE